MSENLVVDEAVRQAELAKLKAELAAAEARVALAQAEVLLAKAERNTEQAKSEAASAPAAPSTVSAAPPVIAPPPLPEPPPIPAPPQIHATNGNGAAKEHAPGANGKSASFQPPAPPPARRDPAPPVQSSHDASPVIHADPPKSEPKQKVPAEHVAAPPPAPSETAAEKVDPRSAESKHAAPPPPPPKTSAKAPADAPKKDAAAKKDSPTKPEAPAKNTTWTTLKSSKQKPPAIEPEDVKALASVADEGDEEEKPQSKRRAILWAGTAWGSSMLVHMVLLLVLGAVTIASQGPQIITELVSSVVERPDEVLTQVLEQEIEPSKDLALVSTAMSSIQGMSGATSVMSEPKVAAQASDIPSATKVDIGEVNVFKSNGTQLSKELPEGSLGEALAIAETYGDAMDRITQEILARLARGKVLVIWCFDQSESMKDDREEIMARIDRVYQELGIAKSAQGDSLLTAVTSYGLKAMTHTKRPTSNVEEIIAAMNTVPLDPSGFEMQCQAAGYAIQTHHAYATQGQRQMMLVMVTDESGDYANNTQYLEATITEAKAARCPIYVLGREAVFGYPYAQMSWRDPKGGGVYWLQIDRGPETPFPEQLQFDGFRRRYDAHASGFGSYEQARMARQTGGVFFMLPSPETNLVGRDNRKYALDAMRPYLPDLSARSDYVAERDKYQMRAILWKVISDLNPYNAQVGRDLESTRGRYSLSPTDYAKEMQPEMNRAKQVILYLSEAQQALEKVKPQREREASPRWRANFDMIYGQTIAYQVRLYEYGATMDAMIKAPKVVKNVFGPKNPTTNWDIYGLARTVTDEKTKTMREQATAIFQQIIVEHAGTPYATRAQWELSRTYGYDFREHHQPPPRPGGGGGTPVKLPKI